MTDTIGHMDRAMRTAAERPGRDEGRLARELRRARRHSRLVARLKVALPVLGLLIVVGGVAVTWLARSLPDDVAVESIGFDNGRIVMEDPRMSGADKNDRPYSVIAQRAFQSLNGEGIDLERVRANVAVGSDVTADIVAEQGHYDEKLQSLRLYGGIVVETSDGARMNLDQADVDLANGTMKGSGSVAIEAPNQTISAGTLDVSDGGRLLSFKNRVKMTMLPSTSAEAGQKLLEPNERP